MEYFKVLLKISRPLGWIIAPLVFVIGFVYSGARLATLPVLQIILLSFPYCILLYGINDIYDYESDKLNPRKKTMKIDLNYHSFVKQVSIIIITFLIISSLLSANQSNILGVLLLTSFSYYYSAPPLRFKERPPLDSVSNGILFFLVFLIGFSFGGSIYEIPLKIYLVGVCVMGVHSFSTIMDYSIDKMAGHKTFAVVFGKKTAALFASAVFLLTYFFAEIGSMVINFYLIFCSLLFSLSFILSSEKLASFIFKLIFVGFILTATSFLITYPG